MTVDTSRFKSNFVVPAGTMADVKSYGGAARPNVPVLCLCDVIGLEPLAKDGRVFPGAHKLYLLYPPEHGGFEDNVVINEPGFADTLENNQKSKRGFKTALESLGWPPEVVDGNATGTQWFMPDANGYRKAAVVWRPGIPGVQGSYGNTVFITRKRYDDAIAAKTDPATLVPPAKQAKAPPGVATTAPVPAMPTGTPPPIPAVAAAVGATAPPVMGAPPPAFSPFSGTSQLPPGVGAFVNPGAPPPVR